MNIAREPAELAFEWAVTNVDYNRIEKENLFYLFREI